MNVERDTERERIARELFEFRSSLEDPIWRMFLKRLIIEVIYEGDEDSAVDPQQVSTSDIQELLYGPDIK